MLKAEIEMKTPITYYGGKQQMLKYILPMIPEHGIYSEPFFGGGAVFWAKKPAKIEFINDRNEEVINFYRVLKMKFPELKTKVDASLHSEGMHREARNIYANPQYYGEVDRAWALWTLSSQSFNSSLDNSWRISRSRSFSSHFQGKKDAFVCDYSKRLETASIFCCDALNVIGKADTDDTFHYVDPPYFNANMGHYGGYTADDFERLLNKLAAVKGKFMLSSYRSDMLSAFARDAGWKMTELDLHRAAGGGRKIEVLTVNYETNVAV